MLLDRDNETNNSGGVNATVARAISEGATVIYVDNFLVPNSVSNLTYSNLTIDSVDLNFTTPDLNTNSISHYEVWIDDGTNNILYRNFKFKEITASGDTLDLTGVTISGLKIRIYTIDEYMNGSGMAINESDRAESNIITLP
jgi:hypothetical protein